MLPLRFSIFPPEITQAVSTRHGGVSGGLYRSLNLSDKVGDDSRSVQHNRRLFIEGQGHSLQKTMAVAQVHSDRVVVVGQEDLGRGVLLGASPAEEADALITQQQGMALLILAADCVPMLFYDPVHNAVGAAHAGWRGTAAGMALRILEALHRAFGTQAADVVAGIGPAIGDCCYEVDEPVLQPLRHAFPAYITQATRPSRPGHAFLDLQKLNRLQLQGAGVPSSQIEVLDLCTSCHTDALYSERREGHPTGRFGALITLPG